MGFVSGFSVVGLVQASNLYPRAEVQAAVLAEELTGKDADEWNAMQANDSRLAPTDDVIYEATEKERGLGYIGAYCSKRDMDRRFGKGRWRAIRRRCVWQEGHQKHRCVDNCRTSGHNSTATMTETIYTVPYDIAVLNFKWLRWRLGTQLRGKWHPALGTDDMRDAYRKIPNRPQQERYCVIAVRTGRKGQGRVQFSIAKAHLFGFSAAVNNFNRLPEFGCAAARRMGAVPCWHFFDDVGTAEVALEQGTGQHFAGRTFDILGFPFSPEKHVPAGHSTLHLGLINELGNADQDAVALLPKKGRVERVLCKISTALSDDWMEPTEASSLRGDITFLACTSYRKILRGGLAGIAERQKELRGGPITPAIKASLAVVAQAVRQWKPVCISLAPESRRPVLVYTDAFFEPDPNAPASLPEHQRVLGGIGAVVFQPGFVPRVYSSPVPAAFWDALHPRETQIMAAELLAIAATVHCEREALTNATAILFGDNLSDTCSLIKGSSRAIDLQTIISGIHLHLASCECSWWAEWLPSDSNPADAPSRGSPSEFGCARPLPCPPWAFPRGDILVSLASLFGEG